jgi:O-antigen/teichoic acid export membrane protein
MKPRGSDPTASDGGAQKATFGNVRLLAQGSAILVSTGVVSYAGTFLLGILLARHLGVLAFGIWTIAYSVARLMSIVGLLGADWIVLRQGSYFEGIGDIPRLRRTIHLALALAGTGLAALSLIVLITADWIAVSVFHQPDLAPVLRLAAILAPIVGIRQTLVYGTQTFKRMKDAALVRNVLQPMMSLAFVGTTVIMTENVEAAFLALIVSETILMVVAGALLRRRMPLLGPVAPVPTREFIGFAIPAWFTRLAGQSRANTLNIALGSLSEQGVSDSALFTAGNKIAGVLFSIVTTMNQVYTAIASDVYLQGKREEWASLYRSVTKWTIMLAAPLFVFMLAFPKEIISIYGRDFSDAWISLVVVSLGMLFQFGTGPVTVTLILIGRPKLALLDYGIVITVEIVLAVVLIKRFGLVGGATAKAVGTALNNVLPLVQVWMRERTWPFRWDFLKPVAAAAIAALVARLLVSATPLGNGVTAAIAGGLTIGLVYLAVLLVLGLSAEDRAVLGAFRLRRRVKGSAGGEGPGEGEGAEAVEIETAAEEPPFVSEE